MLPSDPAERACLALAELIDTLPPGERLPSERALAATWGVGRALVRNALRSQQHIGTITTRPQCGTFVSGNRPAGP